MSRDTLLVIALYLLAGTVAAPAKLFQPHVDYAAGTNPQSVAVGDFNRDGNLDLVVANVSSNTVSLLSGNGNGTFQTPVDYATGSGPNSVAVGDFNGDCNADLAV